MQEEDPGCPSPLPGAPPWAGGEHLPVGPPPDTLGFIVSVSRQTQELLCACVCTCMCIEAGAGCISQTTHVHTDARGNTHIPILLPTVVVVEEVLGSVQHHRPVFKQQKKKVFMPMCSTEYRHVGGPWAREQSRTKPERVQTL